MKTKLKVGILVLACGAAFAIVRGASVEPTTVRSTPAILVGGCGPSSGHSIGVAYVVESFGQWGDSMCGASVFPPTHGVPMPSAGALQNLRVTGTSEFDPGQGSVIAVFVNGSPTALTCTVDSTLKCAGTIHRVQVNAGDEVGATYTVSVTGVYDAMEMALDVR